MGQKMGRRGADPKPEEGATVKTVIQRVQSAALGVIWYVVTESIDHGRWLGAQGWAYAGRPRSPREEDLARVLRDAGVPLHARWTSRRAIAAGTVAAHPEIDCGVDVRGAAAEITASRTEDGDVALTAPPGLAYRPYQRGGVAFALRAFARWQKGVILGDEMGLGKTMQAIGTMQALGADCGRVLVICPASLTRNWAREIGTWLPGTTVYAVNGALDPVAATSAQVLVVNYDKFSGSGAGVKAVQEFVATLDVGLLVLDEAHVLKNPASQRTRRILGQRDRGVLTAPGIVQRARRLLALTGTPVQNRVRELLPLLEALGAVGDVPGTVAKASGAFLFRYCGALKGDHGWTFDGADRLPELQSALRGGWMIRRLKAQVAVELPPKLRQVLYLPAPTRRHDLDDERDEGPDSADLSLVAAGDASTDGFGQVYGLTGRKMAFDEIAAYRAYLAAQKTPHVIAHVRNLLDEDEGRSVLVFAHHQTLVNALATDLAEYGVIRIDGGTPPADRQGLVDRFQTRGARLAVLSTHAAGVGLTLTAASAVVMAEADWNPAWCVQAEDRAHRIGQDADAVVVQYLVLDGTLDARVVRTMVAKLQVAEIALDHQVAATPAPLAIDVSAPAPTSQPAAPPSGRRTVTIQGKRDAEPVAVTLTPDRLDAIRVGLATLSGQCDGAKARDDVGFNGRDAASDFVQSLVVAAATNTLTDRQAAWALRVLRTYHRTQLAHLADRLWPADVEAPVEPEPETVAAAPSVATRLRVSGNTYAHKDAIRAAGGRWDGDRKVWHCPLAARERLAECSGLVLTEVV
jgi:SWI/SNF-related matrix-associated actin-dependent regulator 1 of chromatin subfamily A